MKTPKLKHSTVVAICLTFPVMQMGNLGMDLVRLEASNLYYGFWNQVVSSVISVCVVTWLLSERERLLAEVEGESERKEKG